MSDTMPPEMQEQIDKIEVTTKRGFEPGERLRNRGLRKGSITVYLDEEVGVELGWANDLTDGFGNVVGRDREGVVGDLELAVAERDAIVAANLERLAASEALGERAKPKAADVKAIEKAIMLLEAKRDRLMAELTASGFKIHMRAVPPIIQKDCRRKAKRTLGIEGKRIPDDQLDEFNDAFSAHLMAVMFQSVTQLSDGAVNTETTYEDAIDMMGYLPPGQWTRLDMKLSEIQLTDAISREIESQEDFS